MSYRKFALEMMLPFAIGQFGMLSINILAGVQKPELGLFCCHAVLFLIVWPLLSGLVWLLGNRKGS